MKLNWEEKKLTDPMENVLQHALCVTCLGVFCAFFTKKLIWQTFYCTHYHLIHCKNDSSARILKNKTVYANYNNCCYKYHAENGMKIATEEELFLAFMTLQTQDVNLTFITCIEHTSNTEHTSWTSSERLMYVQFTSCVYGGGSRK